MKKRYFLSALSLLFASSSLFAQEWNKETYPDYNPSFNNPDERLVKFVQSASRPGMRKAAALNLPDHLNNAETKYFPPVFNQAGGSCGSASRFGYMFTHEMNAWRDADGSKVENQYPTHFIWLLTSGNSGKEDFGVRVGIPNVPTYGGRTYSSLFGYQEESNDDFGWMTGYDKWYSGFFNRMTDPTSIPYSLGTEEGRLAAKAWLYNHAGDDSFNGGGIIGLGVASGGIWKYIPRTKNNDLIGVSGKYYVDKWGTSVDHAVTLVGYDDRIEFDLDGNGIKGEVEQNENGEYIKDEKGAWIIVNSWGDWCNEGFIYCPYAYAGAWFNGNGTSDREDDYFDKSSWWFGELYNIRKDYRPFRTIKLRMNYSHRSEMLLQAGVSSDINATEPESVIDMHHFRYAGDGANGDTEPAPEIPMLGRWADGQLHTEPMEFGYDLTDLSASYDRNQALKYFFIVNTKSTAVGEGNIHYASIIDYEHDLQGIETPFDLGETGKVEIKNAGEKTIISVVVQGAAYNAPTGVTISDGKLVWNQPVLSGHTLKGYHIYKEGELAGWTDAATCQWPVDGSGTYSVEAAYSDGNNSARVSASTAVEKADENVVINLSNGGFMIPDIFAKKYQNCTIEYYTKANSLINWNNAYGPGWGTFYVHCNNNGSVCAGWTATERLTSVAATLVKDVWTHLSLVVEGNKMTLYKGSSVVGSYTSSNYSGVGGFGNLVFSASGNAANNCSYDEIRIWDHARTSTDIRKSYTREYHGDVMPDGLLAYYKGDTFEKDGCVYLRDCVGGHHALLTNNNYKVEVPARQPLLADPTSTSNELAINEPAEEVAVGIPVTLTATRNDGVRSLLWTVPALDIKDLTSKALTVTFPEVGTYDVIVKGLGYEKNGVTPEISDTISLTVSNPEAPVADFVVTETEVPAGERISFYATSVLNGCVYEWSLPGSENEKLYAAKVATSYPESGTYTATLTVTSPSGEKAQSSKEIVVKHVKPEADFSVSRSVILKGDSTILSNKSKHGATEIQWTIENSKQKITVNGGQNYIFRPTEPGIYRVSLKASNDLGDDEKIQERAIVVTNADSKNGLSFSNKESRVVLQKAISEDETITNLTIAWWMNPVKLQNYCLGMGESAGTLLLRTDDRGNLQFCAGDGVADSRDTEAAFVIAKEWHHYAVTFAATSGRVRFYRDGELIGSTLLKKGSTTVKSFACPATFAIGTEDAPMNGVIDEFSLWQSLMGVDDIKAIANEPIADPELYITGAESDKNLRLYYQFNQSGGDVQDLTSNKNNGTRVNFGPDGDAWGLSSGVFCLNFGEKKDDVVLDGIAGVKNPVDKNSGAVYNLKGQRVDGNNLTPGVYIQQGRKVIVK